MSLDSSSRETAEKECLGVVMMVVVFYIRSRYGVQMWFLVVSLYWGDSNKTHRFPLTPKPKSYVVIEHEPADE